MKTISDYLEEAVVPKNNSYWKFKTNYEGEKRRKLMCPPGYKSSGPLRSHCVPQSPEEKTRTRFIAFHANATKKKFGKNSVYKSRIELKRHLALNFRKNQGLK